MGVSEVLITNLPAHNTAFQPAVDEFANQLVDIFYQIEYCNISGQENREKSVP